MYNLDNHNNRYLMRYNKVHLTLEPGRYPLESDEIGNVDPIVS